MMLNRTSPNKLTRTWDAVRKAALGVASLAGAAAITGGCLQRPVEPQDPRTNNVYVDQIRQTAVDKIDLLFMIDNSISMADKQEILKDAVPVLVNRLIAPNCVDAMGAPTGGVVDGNGDCANGEPEFNAIKDIHIGIVTSSLGGHGGEVCNNVAANPMLDDRAHMLGSVRAGLPQWNGQGFLAWDPLQTKNNPPGEGNGTALITSFSDHVTQSGEQGCGYEASLEAWYRFLVDPEPPNSVSQQGGVTVKEKDANGAPVLDQTILAQRDAFLRPDSLVAIVMLTDENDCSIIDEGQGWLVGLQTNDGAPFQMPRATEACAADPNNACCRSCASNEAGGPPAGCGALTADPECAKGSLTLMEDNLNLRCYEQKRRFGFDLLYPTQRYVNGLTATEVPGQDGTLLANPLYTPKGDKPARDSSLVFLAGIVGVPWQDVATEATREDPRALTYMTAEELVANNRWDMILGGSGVAPTDPLMIETPDPRTGTHPLTMEPVAPPTSTDQQENIINGHEQNVTKRDDLQYACIFPLVTERDCAMAADTNACDCNEEDAPRNRPLCQGTTQNYAKAYPGRRHLQVLKDFGPNAIVASICPKNVDAVGDPASDPDYGYNPAVGAIISRLKEALSGKCLPRQLVPDCGINDPNLPACDGTNCGIPGGCYSPNGGKVPCAVIEAVFESEIGAGCAPCDPTSGRIEPQEEIRPAVIDNLSQTGQCGNGANEKPCSSLCLCEIQQLTGGDLATCQDSVGDPSGIFGYCYVDAASDPPVGNPAIVDKCPATQKRLLRFVGDNVPQTGAVSFIACIGASLGE